MKKYYFISIVIFLLQGCSQTNQPTNPVGEKMGKKADSFFPVTSFIKGQIFTLDSLPVTPLKLTTIKGKTDSVWIPIEKLKPLLQPFLTPVINETSFTQYFKETRFKDQTLNAVTFTYDPINIIPDSIALRHWDVYVDPETGNVIKVYIVKQIKDNNQIFIQQLTWQTNKQAKIVTILIKPDDNMDLLKEVVYTWDFSNKR